MTKTYCDRCKKESLIVYRSRIQSAVDLKTVDLCYLCTQELTTRFLEFMGNK